ncbi:hypothetical protein J6590_018142 [Homalodisca vitripennis]|nr:hypothetical protein J6590_018142 [Homalodisca vitripennis]
MAGQTGCLQGQDRSPRSEGKSRKKTFSKFTRETPQTNSLNEQAVERRRAEVASLCPRLMKN